VSTAQRLRSFATLDAVTLDANGTLVQLVDPVPTLARLLEEHGAARSPDRIAAAFETEAAYYGSRLAERLDGPRLGALYRDCARVFLEAAEADVDPAEFAPHYVGALRFEVVDGVPEVLRGLRARGLALAVVSNWDVSVHERLDELGLTPLVQTVVASGDVGSAKPDPRIFEVALDRLGVTPERALHVGDRAADERGAAGAGLRFEPAPLTTAFESWT
jgi:putative hydrolase of the HAD superfamily